MTELANESTMVIIDQANSQVETQIRGIERLIEVIADDLSVKTFMNENDPKQNDEVYLTRLSICNKLEEFKDAYPEISGIAIVTHSGNYISNEMYKSQKSTLVLDKWYVDCISNKNEYQITVNPVSRNFTYYEMKSMDEILCVSKAILNENNKVIGAILIDFKLEHINSILENITIGKEGFVVIMDGNENLIYSPVNAIAPRIKGSWFSDESGMFEKNIMNERFQFIYKNSNEFGWRTIGVFSLAATLSQVSEMRNILIIILAGAALLALLLALLFSTTVVRPIMKLEKLMSEAQNGNLYVRFHARYNDEIGSLGRTFNSMLDRMQSLIDQVFAEQKKKRAAEINALQAQIKPHFLYNTFDTIHWLAKKYGAKDIVYIIQCLTNLFRIGLSSGSEIITLREEVSHVENYLRIQKIRYEDIFDFEVDISEELKEFYVHKLILQPLVENAIYHGIKTSRRNGKITIKARAAGDNMVILIEDDGIGMPPEQVRKINNLFKNEKSEGMGYGMFNVNQRIKLSYGSEYGLNVESEEGKGTTITIVNPLVVHLDFETNKHDSVMMMSETNEEK
ncbi:MAG: sensor histidine kinase [Christensenellaceae bacterium]|nr:sensor histidine kinase [Christensenellaceae bacterium]